MEWGKIDGHRESNVTRGRNKTKYPKTIEKGVKKKYSDIAIAISPAAEVRASNQSENVMEGGK